jgi:hypothetical protein
MTSLGALSHECLALGVSTTPFLNVVFSCKSDKVCPSVILDLVEYCSKRNNVCLIQAIRSYNVAVDLVGHAVDNPGAAISAL